MNLTEKIAYIRGLCEGLNLDESKPEIKVMNAIIDLLDDMSYSVTDMEDLYDELSAQVDEIDQDLAEAETELYGEDDDFDYDDDEDDEENEDDVFYEVTCDSCGQKLNVSEDVLLEGALTVVSFLSLTSLTSLTAKSVTRLTARVAAAIVILRKNNINKIYTSRIEYRGVFFCFFTRERR